MNIDAVGQFVFPYYLDSKTLHINIVLVNLNYNNLRHRVLFLFSLEFLKETDKFPRRASSSSSVSCAYLFNPSATDGFPCPHSTSSG